MLANAVGVYSHWAFSALVGVGLTKTQTAMMIAGVRVHNHPRVFVGGS